MKKKYVLMKKCAIVNRTELYRKLVLDFTSVAPLCAYHVFGNFTCKVGEIKIYINFFNVLCTML